MNTTSTPPTDDGAPAPLTGVHSTCRQCATRQVCLLGGLPPAQLKLLDGVVEERLFSKQDVLEIEGVPARRIAVVKLGTIMATRCGAKGHPQPVALFGRGRVLGQYGVYDHAEQLGAMALSSGRLCTVQTADLYRLGVVDRVFHERLQTMIVRSFGRLADWSRVMRFKGIPNQLHACLLLLAQEQGHRSLRLPSHVALAALLSTTRETIARTLRQLEQEGHLRRLDRWHCEMADTPLGALAGEGAPHENAPMASRS